MIPSAGESSRRLLRMNSLRVLWLVWLACVASWNGVAWADAPIPVVTTIPVLKDLVEQVGGDQVRVLSLLNGLENEHSYSPKPSDLVAVKKARLLVEIGAGLEVWVAGLLRSARNPQLIVVTTAEGIELIGGERLAPEHAAAHAQHQVGNPHIWLDPFHAAQMVRRITEALIQAAPSQTDLFRRHETRYLAELAQTTSELLARLRPLSDRRLIVHHPAWPYFAKRFDLQIVGEIQTQSGSEPSPRRLQALIDHIKRDHIRVIVSEPQLNQKLPRLLAQETGAHVVVLTPMPGGVPGTETYLDMLRYNVLQLVDAFGRL